jgi:localization factor PodJL
MTEAIARSFKGLDHETRDVARAAARRAGQTLSDWLDDVIHEKAVSALSGARAEPPDEEPAEPATRRRLPRSRGFARQDARQDLRQDRTRSRSEPSLRREPAEVDADFRRAEPALRSNRLAGERGRSGGREAKAIVDDAVAIFERRASESERKTATALAGLAELIETNHKSRARLGDDLGAVIDRLSRIEHRISRTSDADGVRSIRSALARLEARIEQLSSDDRTIDIEDAMESLDERLAEIAARLDGESYAKQEARRSALEPRAVVRSPERDERRPAPVATRRPLADAIAEITERQRALDAERQEPTEKARDEKEPVEKEPAPARRSAVDFAEIASSLERLSQRLGAAPREPASQPEPQTKVCAQLDQLRDELDNVSRALGDLAPRASVAAVEIALRDLAERVEAQRRFGVEENVLEPVERLTADLRAIIRDIDPGRIVRDLYDEVRTLGDRLADRPTEGGADRAAIAEIAGETREIHELLQAVARRPLPLDKLEASLSALTSRVETLSHADARQLGAREVGDLVSAIRSGVTTETVGRFAAFERKLEEVAAKLDAMSLKSGGGKRFDELGERIDRVHKSLAERIERRSATVDTSHIELLVTKLAKKIDAAIDANAAHPAFDELGRKIERLEERLQPQAPVLHPAFNELGRKIERLEERLQPQAPVPHPAFDELGRKIERLEERLQPQAGPATPPADSEKFRELAERIDFVHEALAARIDDGSRPRSEVAAAAQLTELVAQLAHKMDAALDPTADRAAFSALERQIGELAERIDHSDKSIASFSSMEAAIDRLLNRVEETRDSAAREAEIVAREAAQDVLRHAAAPAGLQEALEKELVELRNMQDETGQRTNETLAAVHETLQRVVDRIAVFEDELTDLRKRPVQQARPEEPAPPRREPQKTKRAARVDDIEDILLEPGDRRPRREPAPERGSERTSSVQADFIAAARRAAQQAAVDAQAAAAHATATQLRNAGKKAPAPERAQPAPSASASVSAGGPSPVSVLQARKRPILLGVGALVLLYGAYQIAQVTLDTPTSKLSAAHVEPEPQDAPESAPAPKAPAEASAAATQAKEPASPAPTAVEPAPKAPQPSASPVAKFPMSPTSAPAAGSFVPPPAPPAKIGAEAADPTPVGAIAAAPISSALTGRGDQIAGIREMATAGDAAAQFELGMRYADGRGVTRDAKSAFQWFEKAANRGLPPAQYRLGSLYEKGIGVDRDYAQARGWYQRAAEAGNARAMHNLAVLYAEGGDSKPDYATAAEWFRKAADYGVRDSQFNLAILYARGLGVTQSLPQSYLWFSAAAAQGDEDAGKKRDEVGARLDSKDFAAAKALAEGFHAKQPDKAANDVAPPAGGWENVKTPAKPEAKPAQKPKISSLAR